MPKRPTDLFGFYIPRSDETHYSGELTNPVTGEVYKPPSMTKQEFVAECDINNILREYSLTGQINHISARAAQGAFLDLPNPMDFQESLAVLDRAESAFAQLPSPVRERFANDPHEFLAFMSDPKNQDEAKELGLLKQPVPLPKVEIANPTPPLPLPGGEGTGGEGGSPSKK